MSNGDWVKATDPNSGRDFYANRVTRETRWEAPPGFIDPTTIAPSFASVSNVYSSRDNVNLESHQTVHQSKLSNNSVRMQSGFGSIPNGFGVTPIPAPVPASNTIPNQVSSEPVLPPNWEEMKDPTSGRSFYVDHVSKLTTWEHPGLAEHKKSANASKSKVNGSHTESQRGTATGFGFIPAPASSSSSRRCDEEPTRRVQHAPTQSMAFAPSHAPSKSYPSSHTFSNTPYTSQHDEHSTKYFDGSGPSSLQKLDFRVTSVADRLRPVCPSCKCPFTISKRRHHCRLCGDIFCDACSNHRVNLPLEGVQFDKPVRVCDFCFEDVDKGNYFSMRRYLTALQLYDVESESWGAVAASEYSFEEEEDDVGVKTGEIKANDVAAALSALAQDLDSVLLDSTSFSEKVTIEANILVPAITKHLELDTTSDRAIRAIGNLLALGNVVGDDSFVLAMYTSPEAELIWGDILVLMEWSGTSTRTLAVQEQAARTLFYLTDAKVFAKLLQMDEQGEVDKVGRLCDVHRSMRIMLDHTTSNASASLQRWAAACIRNLIAEDYRRACDAVTEAMTTGNSTLIYESFTPELLSTGGVMILSSMVASEDSDTRAHAMSALSATITTTRDLNVRLGVLKEAYSAEVVMCSASTIVEAIVVSGACGSSLAQLLLSADDSVAAMGCSFASSLVHPIITNPSGSVLPSYHRVSSASSFNLQSLNQNGLESNRKAALEFASNDGLLTALIQLVREPMYRQKTTRSLELRCCAMEILASISLAISFWDNKLQGIGNSLEGANGLNDIKHKVESFQARCEEEQVAGVVAAAYSSASVINTSRDSPALRLREAASLVMASIASCSEAAAKILIQNNVVNDLISIASDSAMITLSARGEYFPRCLAMLEAVASILLAGWKMMQTKALIVKGSEKEEDALSSQVSTYNFANQGSMSSTRSSSLDLLLEAIDAGIIPLVNRLIEPNIEYNSHERAYGSIRVKIACTHIVAAMFGIAQCDKTAIGIARIFEGAGIKSVYKNTYGNPMQDRDIQNLIPSTVNLLQSTINEAQHYLNDKSGKSFPLLNLLEGTLLALGSMCGSRFCSFKSREEISNEAMIISTACLPEAKEQFWNQFDEACTTTCNVLTMNSSLPSLLVGAYGEESVMPTLRLALATVENSLEGAGEKLARSGVIVPLSDILKDALGAGDHYTFSACVSLISYCGPHINAKSGESSGIQSLRESVALLSTTLAIEERPNATVTRKQTLQSLKRRCIFAIERVSTNSSLWSTIVSTFVPCVSKVFVGDNEWFGRESNSEDCADLCAALQVILRVIALPSHAASISQTNIEESLCKLISDEKALDRTDDKFEFMALQIIHTILSYSVAQHGNKHVAAIDVSAATASCCVLRKQAHASNKKTAGDNKNGAAITKLGLEVIELVLVQIDTVQNSDASSQKIKLFADNIVMHPGFLSSLCATMLLLVNDKHTDSANAIQDFSIAPFYGPALVTYDGCLDTAVSLLFRISFLCTITQTETSDLFWDTFLIKECSDMVDEASKNATIVASCAILLKEIDDETGGICVPKNPAKYDYFQRVELPLVRIQILHGLRSVLTDIVSTRKHDEKDSNSFSRLMISFRIPQTCLSLCRDPKMIDHSVQVLEIILAEFSDSLLAPVMEDKASLASLFGLLSIDAVSNEVKTKPGKIRVFAAVALSAAGDQGILGFAVQRLGLRRTAIASLSAACLMEEQDSLECLAEDLTCAGLSISDFCMRCLVSIVSANDEASTVKSDKMIMSSAEASAISSVLGKKLSEMVLSRFVDEAKIDEESNDQKTITKSPEVILLCALASFEEALPHICAHGGLEALSLIASEGEISAIHALYEASKGDPSLVLGVDGHTSVMQFIASHEDNNFGRDVGSACLNLLIALSETRKGKKVICGSDLCDTCIDYASTSVKNFTDVIDAKSSDETVFTSPPGEEGSISEDTSLEISCLTFLKSLLTSKRCREIISKDEILKLKIDLLIVESNSSELQYEVVNFLTSLCRYSSGMEHSIIYSVESLLATLMSILKPDRQTKRIRSETNGPIFGDLMESHRCNRNLVLSAVCLSLESMVSNMTPSNEADVLNALILQCSSVVDFHLSPAKKIAKNTMNSGILMNNITFVFLQLGSSFESQKIIKTTHVLSVLSTLLLLDPFDSADPLMEEDAINWRCAQTHCLQYLATLAIEPISLEDNNELWEESVSNAEKRIMESRKSRRVRKKGTSEATISFLQTVQLFSTDKNDATRMIAAKKLLSRLDGCI